MDSLPDVRHPLDHLYERSVKRLLDIGVSLLALAFLAPVLGVIAIFIRVTMGTPVLFRQTRPGYKKRALNIVKFRTMRELRPGESPLHSDAERLTPLGSFLRRTSLDELPELWSVLKGDMSLVGPRPLLVQYLPYYTEHESIRFKVRPGITGLAQVSGRNLASWDERLQLDAWYVENWSLTLDLKILWRTIGSVFRSQGVVIDARSVMLNLDEERSKHPWCNTGGKNSP